LILRSGGNDLSGPLPVYVATGDGVRAAEILHALEREGVHASVSWGPLTEVTKGPRARSALVVVLESEEGASPDSAYRSVRDALPDAAIVVVASPERIRPQNLLWAGVDGIVLEPGADALIGPVVRSVLEGYIVMPKALRGEANPPPLSARERQMLELVVEGLTNREIAQRLYLAESTVKRHLSTAFRRLGVHSRREAAAAMRAAEPAQAGGYPTEEPSPFRGS
jgi:DNA-binding NarL/FixJ family response regulator